MADGGCRGWGAFQEPNECWHCKSVMGGLNETIKYSYAVSLD